MLKVPLIQLDHPKFSTNSHENTMKSCTKSPRIPGFTINMIGFLSISPETNPMNLSSTGLIMQRTNCHVIVSLSYS